MPDQLNSRGNADETNRVPTPDQQGTRDRLVYIGIMPCGCRRAVCAFDAKNEQMKDFPSEWFENPRSGFAVKLETVDEYRAKGLDWDCSHEQAR